MKGNFQTTPCHNAEDHNIYFLSRSNIKSQTIMLHSAVIYEL